MRVKKYDDRYAMMNPSIPSSTIVNNLVKTYKLIFECHGETTTAPNAFYYDFAGVEE
jgi:hypothetical protein